MRVLPAALLALILAAPAHAWQAGREGGICTLTHSENGVDVRLTHDPSLPLWTITTTSPEPWPQATVFAIAFLGGAEITITTDRHSLSEDARALSVTDRGFGNVLAGLAGNTRAVFLAGGAEVSVSLEGAAPEVAAFEACGTAPAV